MLDIVLASFINSSQLIHADMVQSTWNNMLLNKNACESNPIVSNTFNYIGIDNTYYLTIGAIGVCSLIGYNINKDILYIGLKSLSAIEFFFAVKNDFTAKYNCKYQANVYAKFQIFEYTF